MSVANRNARIVRTYLLGIGVRAETGVQDPRLRIPGTPLRLEEILGLGEDQDAAPGQVGFQPGGAGARANLQKRPTPHGK